MIGRIFLAIGAIIGYALALITFAGTSTSASLSNFTFNIPPGDTTDNQNGRNITETEPPQDLTPSESLTLSGLSPQGGSDLSIACSWAQPRPC